MTRLQRIKDKQKLQGIANLQAKITKNRNNKVNDYISKTAKWVINYCISHKLGILVVGYNESFQQTVRLGKRNNQTFVNILYGKLYNKLEYLCQLNGIQFVKQEESYTSKASFWDKDELPVYKKGDTENYSFSGKRIHRGLYQTKEGRLLNADVNGALNI